MNQFCQIEYVLSDCDSGKPCGKTAVTKCGDCGASICSDCNFECCGDSFCELCYDYHATHSCVRKPVQNERHIFGSHQLAKTHVTETGMVLFPLRATRRV